MLWDMEVRKSANPGRYIPYVVRAGSDRSWNRHRGDGGEYLDRCSVQRLWLSPQRYELIANGPSSTTASRRSPSGVCLTWPARTARCCARAPASRCYTSSTLSAAPNSSR
jgi:hypothetical protein